MSIFASETSALAGGSFPMVPIGSLFVERSERGDAADYPPLSVGKMGVTPQLENVAKAADTSNRKLARQGDIVINSRSDRRGAAGLAPADGTVSVVYTVLDPGPLVDRAYAHHMIRSVGFQEEYFRFGTGIVDDLWSTRYDRLATIRVPLPSLDVQRRLAVFLDRETAEIDAMDAELNGLIQTLQERRSVSIESVLANSGRRAKLGYFVDTLAGNAFSAREFSRDDRDIRLLRGVNVKPHGTDWTEAVYWPKAQADGLDRYFLEPGDVALGMDRPFVSTGTRAVIITQEDLPALLLQRVLRLRPLANGSPQFLLLLLMTKEFEHYATPETTGISVPHISEGQVLDFPVAIPSTVEQKQLADRVLSEVKEVDEMIADANHLKLLLAERRSTLITEVVTGKKEVPA